MLHRKKKPDRGKRRNCTAQDSDVLGELLAHITSFASEHYSLFSDVHFLCASHAGDGAGERDVHGGLILSTYVLVCARKNRKTTYQVDELQSMNFTACVMVD